MKEEAIVPAADTAFARDPLHRKLTTQKAADLLGVSRPHFTKLLDRGDIPHTKTGAHRRVLLQDFLTYRDERFRRAGEVLKAMVDEEKKWDLG